MLTNINFGKYIKCKANSIIIHMLYSSLYDVQKIKEIKLEILCISHIFTWSMI